jgi:hypothetical protein
MRSTVTLETNVLDELVKETGAKSKTAAVGAVIGEYLLKKRIEHLLALAGKLEFDMTAEEIRHRER